MRPSATSVLVLGGLVPNLLHNRWCTAGCAKSFQTQEIAQGILLQAHNFLALRVQSTNTYAALSRRRVGDCTRHWSLSCFTSFTGTKVHALRVQRTNTDAAPYELRRLRLALEALRAASVLFAHTSQAPKSFNVGEQAAHPGD